MSALRVMQGTEPPAVTIEFVSPATHGPRSGRGYFEVWCGGSSCGHRHFKSKAARVCAARLERWIKNGPPP